jgi:hypothetical protein
MVAAAAALLGGAMAISDEPPVLTVSPPRGSVSSPTLLTVAGAAFEPGARVALLGGGPFLAGAYPLPEGSRSVEAGAHRVSLAFYSHTSKAGGMQILDVDDPARPVRVGGFETGDSGIGIASRDGIGYIAFLNPYTFLGGLHIVDLDHPGGAVRLGTFYTFTDPQAMALDAGHAFVADGANGLRIIDVTDPAAPFETAAWPSQGIAHDVTVRSGRAFVADGAGGLQLLDVRDPFGPRSIGGFAPPGADILSVAVDGDVVCATDRTHGLLVLDVADPAAPQLLAEMPLPDAANGLAWEGPLLYAATGASGLQIVDVASPRNPRVVGSRGLAGNTGYFFDVAVAEDHVYVADLLNGLQVIDAARPASPALAGGTDLPGATPAVAVDADLAVAGDGSGLAVLDLAGGGVVSTGRLETTVPVLGVAVSGGAAIAAASTAGLLVIDLADPEHPAVRGSADTPGEAQGVAIAGTLAYVADGSRGLAIYDLADRTAPALLGTLDTTGTARAVAVAGSRAYVADDFRGLLVIDVSSPAAPVLLSRLDTPGRASGVAVAGGLAYVADLNRGVQVIDVTNPTAPQLVRTIGTPGAASGVALLGSRLVVADGFAGLLEFDVSRPDAPVSLGSYDTPGVATGVATALSASGVLLVADGPRGVRSVRLNPLLPPAVPDGAGGLRQEIPAGFAPGPYDVQAMTAEGIPIGPPVRNGFIVCGGGDLSARLEPSRLPSPVGPTPAPWRLVVSGDASLFDPPPRHAALLRLPALPGEPIVRQDSGRESIEIRIPAAGPPVVLLSGRDREAMLSMWRAAVAAGGFPLPRLDTRTYGPLRLEVHPGRGDGAPRRIRYEFDAGILTGAAAWGDGARLDFEVTAVDPLGCDSRVVESL